MNTPMAEQARLFAVRENATSPLPPPPHPTPRKPEGYLSEQMFQNPAVPVTCFDKVREADSIS